MGVRLASLLGGACQFRTTRSIFSERAEARKLTDACRLVKHLVLHLASHHQSLRFRWLWHAGAAPVRLLSSHIEFQAAHPG
jgi:hypothetical protein